DELLVCWTVFGLADLLSELGAPDFGVLTHPCLAEDGQQDRGTVRSEPVRDAYGSTVEGGPQLTNSVAQVADIGFDESRSVFREQPDVFVDLEEVLGRQRLQPIPHLGLDLDGEKRIHPTTLYVVDDICKMVAPAAPHVLRAAPLLAPQVSP